MPYRLVILDMDGTLLTDDKRVTPRTEAAIAQGLARGVKFVLATARPYCSARPFAQSLGLDTPIICYNGALVRDVSNGTTLAEKPLSSALASEMARYCQKRGLYMKVYGDDIFYVERPTEETLRYSPRYNVPYKAVGDMASFLYNEKLSPYSFVVHTQPEDLRLIKEEMESIWAGLVSGDCPNEHAIHFTDAGASKLRAVKALAVSWGIPAEETMAIGNGGNDLAVILWSGLGIAVANSPHELLAQADRVTASNNDEGVAKALEEYLLPGSEGLTQEA